VISHVTHSLCQTKHAYLKSGWNVLDTAVLAFAIVDELQLFEGGNIAKMMRLARALRPLRLMKRNAGTHCNTHTHTLQRASLHTHYTTLFRGTTPYVLKISMWPWYLMKRIACTHCNTPTHTATHASRAHTATHASPAHTATHLHTLQHAIPYTHCNTLFRNRKSTQ